MKDCYYTVKTAFTKDRLLRCECTYKCGGEMNEQITCVHSLVPIFLLTLLLCEGLAEHFLLELSARLSVTSDIYNIETQSQFLDNIQLLIACADGLKYDYDSSKKIKDYNVLLQRFSVGTEKRKSIPIGKIDKSFIVELRTLSKESAVKKAIAATNAVGVNDPLKKEKIISQLSKKHLNTAIDPTLDDKKFIPDYESCWLLAEAAGIDIDKITECSNVPGYRLLRLRVHDALKKHPCIKMTTKRHGTKKMICNINNVRCVTLFQMGHF